MFVTEVNDCVFLQSLGTRQRQRREITRHVFGLVSAIAVVSAQVLGQLLLFVEIQFLLTHQSHFAVSVVRVQVLDFDFRLEVLDQGTLHVDQVVVVLGNVIQTEGEDVLVLDHADFRVAEEYQAQLLFIQSQFLHVLEVALNHLLVPVLDEELSFLEVLLRVGSLRHR